MPYIPKIVGQDEELQGIARLHWIYVLKGVVWFLILAGSGWILNNLIGRLLTYMASATDSFALPSALLTISNGMTFFLMAGGFAIFGFYVLMVLVTEVGLTNRRIIHKTGWVFVKTHQVDHEEIRGESLDLGYFGKLLGYGYIMLDCRFVGDVKLPAIENPERFLRALHAARAGTQDALSIMVGKSGVKSVKLNPAEEQQMQMQAQQTPEIPQPSPPPMPAPESQPGQVPGPEINPPGQPQTPDAPPPSGPEVPTEPAPHQPNYDPPAAPPPQQNPPEQPIPAPPPSEPPLQPPSETQQTATAILQPQTQTTGGTLFVPPAPWTSPVAPSTPEAGTAAPAQPQNVQPVAQQQPPAIPPAIDAAAMAQAMQQIMPQMAEEVAKQLAEKGMLDKKNAAPPPDVDNDLIAEFDDARFQDGDPHDKLDHDKVEHVIH